MKRVLLFAATMFFGFIGVLWVFVPLLAWYIFLYTGIEVLFIAACIDAYFGYGTAYPFIYTLCTGLALLVAHILRPVLSVYNQ